MDALEHMIRDLMAQARLSGYIEGLIAFAWWKDGIQYVGTTGLTLKEAIARAQQGQLWNQSQWGMRGDGSDTLRPKNGASMPVMADERPRVIDAPGPPSPPA